MQRVIQRDVRNVFESVDKKRAFPDLPRPSNQHGGESRKRFFDCLFYVPCNVHNPPHISVDLEYNSIITDECAFVKRNMDQTAERSLQILSKEEKMKRNKMGNLLSIAGDDAEELIYIAAV